MVCAIQCAIFPILLSVAPIVPKWAHFGHGWVWISIILLIAVWSIGRGFNRHRNKPVVYIALMGISLLLFGTILDEQLKPLLESAIFVTGGISLTIAHWKNYQLEKTCNQSKYFSDKKLKKPT